MVRIRKKSSKDSSVKFEIIFVNEDVFQISLTQVTLIAIIFVDQILYTGKSVLAFLKQRK